MDLKSGEVGFAVIGAGLVGPTHAAAAARAPGGRLVVVCDTVAERAEAVAERVGVEWTTEVDAALERADEHVVSICLPRRLHLEIAARVAAAGKHLIIEKPLELSLERADRLLAVAREHRVEVRAIFNRRFLPALQATHRAVAEGRLLAGDMSFNSFRSQDYYDGSGWRGTWAVEGGAALINQGIHGVDLLRWIAGPVERVFGYADHLRRDIEADDTTVAVLRYTSGAMRVVQAMTSIQPRLPDRLEFQGERNTIQLEDYRITRWDVPGAEDWRARVAVEEQSASVARDLL